MHRYIFNKIINLPNKEGIKKGHFLSHLTTFKLLYTAKPIYAHNQLIHTVFHEDFPTLCYLILAGGGVVQGAILGQGIAL